MVRSAALRRYALSLLKDISIGLRSGEYLGRYSTRANGLDRFLHAGNLVGSEIVHHDDIAVVERGGQALFEVREKDFSVHGPSITKGAVISSQRRPATKVRVFQVPSGTRRSAARRAGSGHSGGPWSRFTRFHR